jgi:hypothetical protein
MCLSVGRNDDPGDRTDGPPRGVVMGCEMSKFLLFVVMFALATVVLILLVTSDINCSNTPESIGLYR